MTKIIIGDYNVSDNWTQALNDRKELRGQISFVRCDGLSSLVAALSSIKPHHTRAVLSILTGPICHHIKNGSSLSLPVLQNDVRKLLTTIMQDHIIPMCKRNPETKVKIIHYTFVIRKLLSRSTIMSFGPVHHIMSLIVMRKQ